MKGRKAASLVLSLLVVLSLLLLGLPGNAVSQAQAGIVIDGVKEAAWGDPLALDPAGDMTEPNLDLTGLYVVEDADNYYIGFDATASTWGMTYGIYIDTDQVDGSGATTDPWSRSVNAVSPHLPEHTLYVWHDGADFLQDVQLNHWTGSWSSDSLSSQGGEQGYGPANDWIEYRVPKAALGNPPSIALEVFTTGGDGHAQDTVPSDPNVAFTNPDWNAGLITTLSAFATFPLPSWYIAGDFNGWSAAGDAMYDDGTHGDATAGDGVYTAQIVIADAGRHEFKVTNGTWDVTYPGSGNSWFDCTAGETVTFTFDGNVRSDGWLPMTHIIGVSTEPGTWTAVGDWQAWQNADPATAMTGLGGGVYQLATTIATPGSYQYKAVRTTTWDAIGADGRGVNASTVPFDILEAGQGVTFTVDALAGRVMVETEPTVPQPQPDNNIWWDGVRHDSRDDFYRTPFGAVTTGTPVVLRLRTYANDVTEVKVRVWNTALNGQTFYSMTRVATIPGTPYDYDVWELELTAPNYLTVLYYRFIVIDGTDTDYYEDDDLFDGGLGQMYDDSPDHSYQIDVYDPAFSTPDWFEDAVVYQIFPDRFRNGVAANDPISGTFFYDEDPGVLSAPEWNWPVPDPRVPGSDWEGSYSKLFYGGDLQGIIDKLDYLQTMGVNTLYLNPIFESPSNHKYDTTNYELIDDNFGDLATFQALVAELDARGMHLVLDGVFNHTSSDSQYFDRYGRYGSVGACEDVNSPYRSWYYFYPANPPGSGVCAGDTTYNAWWGFDSLPKLNTTDEPGVRSYIYSDPAAVATYWIGQGADGWRLDVAGDVDPSFWRDWRPYIEAADPNAIVIAEEWGDASRFVLGDQLDSTMNYRFRNAVIGLLRDTDWTDTNSTIRALSVSEFDSAMHGIEEDYPAEVWYTLMNLVGSHDTNRVLIPLDQDGNPADDNYADGKARLSVLALIQMTMPGAPTIYYGDEVGLVGHGDDAGGGVYYADPYNRQPYPWPDEEGYDTLPLWRQRDLALRTYYQRLISVRNAHPALRTGSFDTLLVDDANQLYAYGRKDLSTYETAVVVVNRDAVAHDVTIDVSGYIGDRSGLRDMLGSGAVYHVIGDQLAVPTVPAMSGLVLIMEWGDATPPAAPANLAATDDNGRVDLTWDPVADAVSYNLYRSYVQGGGYELLASGLTATAYTDTAVENGHWYYYVVTAVDLRGNESEDSNEAAALPHVPIGWAGNLEPTSISILIGQSTPPIYAQVWVDGVTNAPGQGAGILAEIGWGPATVPYAQWTTWTPMTYLGEVGNNDQYTAVLTPEIRGQFRYLARFSTTLGRDWTYARTAEGRIPILTVRQSGDTTPPRTPQNLRVIDWSATTITLGWDPVLNDPTLYAYDVFRSDASGTVGPMVGRVLAPTTEFTDVDLTTGQTYYYVVQAVDSSFNRSGYSNEVAATPEPKLVNVTFEVTVPDWTPDGATVYIVGDIAEFCGWCNPQTVALNQVDDITWTRAFSLPDGLNIQYKYTRGNWDINEWWGPIVGVNNRQVTVDWGTTGTQLVADTVPYWRDPIVIEHDPMDGATGVDPSATISVTLSRYLDPATIIADNLILTSGTSTPTLDIAWVHRTDMTATNIYLTPQSPLDPGTTYTMNLLTGLAGLASDNEGIHLQQPYAWSFTTADAPIVLNEFSASTTGTDVEYVEAYGGPNVDYSAYTILEIEGDSGTTLGHVDEVIAVGTTDASGFWLGNLAANALENGTISLLLVKDFTGALGQDLDTNDDGVLDVTPWTALVDGVSVNDGGAGDLTYGVPALGVSYDGLPFAPGGASRYPDGTDTDTAADWVRNDFDLAGIPGYAGSIVEGEAYNTPGATNQIYIYEPPAPVLNEFSASTTGTDVEYVEAFGAPDTDYSAYTILEIEGDSGTSLGFVDEVIAVGTTDAAGFWLGSLAANALENGTISLLLVEGFTGALGQDLDTNDDGVLDVTPWSALVDGVSVNDGGAGDLTYGVPALGVSYDGLPYAPGGASRYPDGTDTDTTADWVRNDFDLAGLPGYAGSIIVGEAYNTPGVPNEIYVEAPPVLNEFSASTTGTDVEYVEVYGAPDTNYGAYTILEIEGDSGTTLGVVDEVIAVGTTDASGFWLGNLAANALENGTISLLLVKDFTGALNQDLDTNDDGALDVTPWTALVDGVSVNDGGAGDLTYGVPALGVSYDGLPYAPGGASRYPDGTDTDTTADWVRNDFDLAGLPGYPGTIIEGEAYNTPGLPNEVYVEAPPVINEFSASTTGTDVEYVEVFAVANTDYSAYTILEIEGDSGTTLGVVDEVIPVGTTDATGFWLGNLAANALENGTISLLLVEGFSGALNQDLDTNDDGVLDVTPWTALVDGVSVDDGGAGDLTYGVPELGVSYDGLPFAPGGASRYPDGTDTDTTADWVRNDFDLAGIPGFPGTIIEGEAYNTPGLPNEIYVPPTEACGDPFTAVYAVQGNGASSPLVGTEVSVEAVVVGDFQNNAELDDGDLNGFHVQDPIGDGDPATSDGIFIYAAGAADVQVGDLVRVHGTVSEYNGMTEITAAEVWDCGTGTVPAATPIALPVTVWAEYEPYEGMLVTLPQTLYVAEYFNFDRYGEIMVSTDRQIQPTAIYEPGSPEQAALALQNSLSRLTIDDGRTAQNPDPAIHPNGNVFNMTNLFRGGDTVQNVTGVLDYAINLYRIQPTQGALYTPVNTRTAGPDPVGGTLKVASFNVLNYFTTIDTGAWICGPSGNMECRGADTPEELARQRAKIVAALAAINADVVGLIEIENHATNVPTADLVAGLNDILGAGTYDYIATGFIGTDAIEQAFIYKPASVTPVGAYAILDSTVDPTFIDTLNRPVLAQSFTDNATGAVLTVAVNHLKSKGSECPGDPDTGDGSGNCNLTRTAAATALVNWLATDPTGSGDGDFLIIGDLNSYDKETPIDAILAGGYTDLIHNFLGEFAYSYLFDAGLGYLDHALANAALLTQVTGVTVWHINADEPDLIDYDMTFKLDPQDALYAPDAYRASDHDPVIIGLNLVP